MQTSKYEDQKHIFAWIQDFYMHPVGYRISEYKPNITLKKICNCAGCIYGKLKSNHSSRVLKKGSTLKHIDSIVEFECDDHEGKNTRLLASMASQRSDIFKTLNICNGLSKDNDANSKVQEREPLLFAYSVPVVAVRKRRKNGLKTHNIPSYNIVSDVKTTFWSFSYDGIPNSEDDLQKFVTDSNPFCRSDNDVLNINQLFTETNNDLIVLSDSNYAPIACVNEMPNNLFVNDVMVILTFVEGCYDDPVKIGAKGSKRNNKCDEALKGGVFVTAKIVPIDFLMSDVLKSEDIPITNDDDGSAFGEYYGDNGCITRSNSFYFDTTSVERVVESEDLANARKGVKGVSVPLRFGMFDNCIVDSVDPKLYDACSALDQEMCKSASDRSDVAKEFAEKRGKISEAYDYRRCCVRDASKREESSEGCICHKNCPIFSDQTKNKVSCKQFGKYNVVFCGEHLKLDDKKSVTHEYLWNAHVKNPENAFDEQSRIQLNYYKNYGKWFLSKCKVSGKHPTSKWRSKIDELEVKMNEYNTNVSSSVSSTKGLFLHNSFSQ